MAVANYLVIRENDQDVRIELGDRPGYSIMADGIVRVWDEHRTWVFAVERLICLCIPNFGPPR